MHEVSTSHTADQLVELADMCLYRAKENGRDCAFKVEMHCELPSTPVNVEQAPEASVQSART